jgi:dihydropyrimidine dehydrogenase (NAD+) subunit PreT
LRARAALGYARPSLAKGLRLTLRNEPAFDVTHLGSPVAQPLSRMEVMLEANRCLDCYDAPCIAACPTSIDIPSFIKKIATGNMAGSARTILDANPLGASCARVCPTAELCEGACVYHEDATPIRIGDLQRYAIDWLMSNDRELFTAGTPTGKRVAIIGAGPAGLSAARDLARAGHAVTIFERREHAGGLNTFGIVPFRLPVEVALWEAAQVARLGVDIRTGVEVGTTIMPDAILADYDAVILAFGMGSVPQLGIPGEDLRGVEDALDIIERAKFGKPVALGQHVAIIGAGNTAIDAATTARRLGAEFVTMWYRRGAGEMTAYPFEVEFARSESVAFRFHRMPVRIEGAGGDVRSITFAQSMIANGAPVAVPGTEETVRVDSVIRAIGQKKLSNIFDAFGVRHDRGIAIVDDALRTTNPKVYAAGDCIFRTGLTDAMVVVAAQQGKTVAASIDRVLREAKV